MAQCDFSIPFQSSAQAIADKAKHAISGAGGTFEGTAESGAFDISTPLGAVRGSYQIQGNILHVSILSKPLFVSCSLIEKQLRDYLATKV